MKRDMDLIREILLQTEQHENGYAPDLEIDGYTSAQIGYHQFLIIDAGLAEGADVTHRGSEGPMGVITHLTSAGHDFLDAARSKTVWQQAKDAVDPIGGASIQVWTAILTDLVRRNLGLGGD